MAAFRSIAKCHHALALTGLALVGANARAELNNVGVFDTVFNRYQSAAATWGQVILTHATFLFWALATISMVWTMGMMLLRRADIGEMFAEFLRFIIFTGFFWWLLSNGPVMAGSLISSLRQIGGEASGIGAGLSPSGIVDIGFEILTKVVRNSTAWNPVDSAFGILLAMGILLVLALIGTNILLQMVGAWILAYAGVFFLGFGGSRWTSDMAIGYFKTVLCQAAQLMTMVLLIGIGRSFIDKFYESMTPQMGLSEMAVMFVVVFILFTLIQRIPPMVGQLAFGGSSGSIGNLGPGSAVGAVAMGAAAVASAGAALAAAATSAGGGASALMAAVQKAGQNVENGTDLFGGALGAGAQSSNALGSGGAGNELSPLAAAMGDHGEVAQMGTSGRTGFGSGDAPGGFSVDGAFARGRQDATATGDPEAAAEVDTRSDAAHAEKPSAITTQASGESKPGRMATAGRIAADATANLAQGALSVAKEAANNWMDAAKGRIAETTGGKIACAIRGDSTEGIGQDSGTAGAAAGDSNTGRGGGPLAGMQRTANLLDSSGSVEGGVAEFGNNSLGRRADAASLAAEVAAFRDSKDS